MLDELSNEAKIVGIKQLRRSMKDGQVRRVYLAENADPILTEPLEVLCKKQGIELVWVPTMTVLGKACGICVGAAAAGLLKKE